MKAASPSTHTRGFAYSIYGGARRYLIRGDGSFIARGQNNETGMNADRGVADPAGHFLYLSGYNGGGPCIAQFRIRADGSLTQIFPQVMTPGAVNRITVSADGRYVYVHLVQSTHGHDRVGQYLIKKSGALKLLARPAVDAVTAPQLTLLTDPGSHFLYAVDYPGLSPNYTVAQYKILPSGALRPLNPPVVPLGRTPPLAVTVDGAGHVLRGTVQAVREPCGVTAPARPGLIRRDRTLYLVPTARHGRFCFWLNPRLNKIALYRVSVSGRLLALPPMVPCDPGMGLLVPGPGGDYLYASGDPRLVDRYFVPVDGRLRPMTTANLTAQFEAGYLVVARPARH